MMAAAVISPSSSLLRSPICLIVWIILLHLHSSIPEHGHCCQLVIMSRHHGCLKAGHAFKHYCVHTLSQVVAWWRVTWIHSAGVSCSQLMQLIQQQTSLVVDLHASQHQPHLPCVPSAPSHTLLEETRKILPCQISTHVSIDCNMDDGRHHYSPPSLVMSCLHSIEPVCDIHAVSPFYMPDVACCCCCMR